MAAVVDQSILAVVETMKRDPTIIKDDSDTSQTERKPPRTKKTRTRRRHRTAQKEDENFSYERNSHIVALDCEMVDVGGQSALARVSIVDWNGFVLLDT